tara:strand:- start:40 stop:270 length:231 start_codon:yes stop_codon:yes gene_type:complete
MQTQTFTLVHNLSQLHDELQAAIPNFHRTHENYLGERELSADGGRVSARGNEVIIEFADDISASAVRTVVDAHTPA